MNDDFKAQAQRFAEAFPNFAGLLASGVGGPFVEIEPAAPAEQIAATENLLGIPLPASYKQFLLISAGVSFGGSLQIGLLQTFFHDFPKQESLSEQARRTIARRGGVWPPPSQGMLRFADYFLEADGDQALFDVSQGLNDGEYPVIYYDHDTPSIRKLADSFRDFVENVIAQNLPEE
jgi:cell wall assembly regulator SMI1